VYATCLMEVYDYLQREVINAS